MLVTHSTQPLPAQGLASARFLLPALLATIWVHHAVAEDRHHVIVAISQHSTMFRPNRPKDGLLEPGNQTILARLFEQTMDRLLFEEAASNEPPIFQAARGDQLTLLTFGSRQSRPDALVFPVQLPGEAVIRYQESVPPTLFRQVWRRLILPPGPDEPAARMARFFNAVTAPTVPAPALLLQHCAQPNHPVRFNATTLLVVVPVSTPSAIGGPPNPFIQPEGGTNRLQGPLDKKLPALLARLHRHYRWDPPQLLRRLDRRRIEIWKLHLKPNADSLSFSADQLLGTSECRLRREGAKLNGVLTLPPLGNQTPAKIHKVQLQFTYKDGRATPIQTLVSPHLPSTIPIQIPYEDAQDLVHLKGTFEFDWADSDYGMMRLAPAAATTQIPVYFDQPENIDGWLPFMLLSALLSVAVAWLAYRPKANHPVIDAGSRQSAPKTTTSNANAGTARPRANQGTLTNPSTTTKPDTPATEGQANPTQDPPESDPQKPRDRPQQVPAPPVKPAKQENPPGAPLGPANAQVAMRQKTLPRKRVPTTFRGIVSFQPSPAITGGPIKKSRHTLLGRLAISPPSYVHSQTRHEVTICPQWLPTAEGVQIKLDNASRGYPDDKGSEEADQAQAVDGQVDPQGGFVWQQQPNQSFKIGPLTGECTLSTRVWVDFSKVTLTKPRQEFQLVINASFRDPDHDFAHHVERETLSLFVDDEPALHVAFHEPNQPEQTLTAPSPEQTIPAKPSLHAGGKKHLVGSLILENRFPLRAGGIYIRNLTMDVIDTSEAQDAVVLAPHKKVSDLVMISGKSINGCDTQFDLTGPGDSRQILTLEVDNRLIQSLSKQAQLYLQCSFHHLVLDESPGIGVLSRHFREVSYNPPTFQCRILLRPQSA